MSTSKQIIPAARIEKAILSIRGEKVLLDADLAALYGVETRSLLRAVRRNIQRFPSDFMFELTSEEATVLRSQIGISSLHGGRRYLPYVFTELGVAMLSSVLRSERAIQVNIEIMRTFVQLRQLLASNVELRRKVDALERKYNKHFAVVFAAIRKLMEPERTTPTRGFAR